MFLQIIHLTVARKLPCSFDREYQEEPIWKSFTTFIRAVVPAAEKNHVRIGLHPDDQPVQALGCVALAFRTYAAYGRAFDIAASDNFGVCLCIGTWAEGGKPAVRAFGARKKIFKVHFRNVSSPLPRFRETFVDNGYIDMCGVMKALQEVGGAENFSVMSSNTRRCRANRPSAGSSNLKEMRQRRKDRVPSRHGIPPQRPSPPRASNPGCNRELEAVKWL